MLFIAYIVIAIAALVMVYFGHLQGTSQFYTSILGATIVLYCVTSISKSAARRKPKKTRRTASLSKRHSIPAKNPIQTSVRMPVVQRKTLNSRERILIYQRVSK